MGGGVFVDLEIAAEAGEHRVRFAAVHIRHVDAPHAVRSASGAESDGVER